MSDQIFDRPARLRSWPVLAALALLVGVTLVFLIEFVISTETEIAARRATPEPLAADAYADQLAALLVDADSANGARLVEQHHCTACHRQGAANGIAPAFVGLSERAVSRRPPLSAAAYVYESIVHPLAFVVEGFNPAMPQNYPEVLSDQELGDIIAYLLTSDAH